ncbi:MAG TPA: choice-of-anchor tandem repeat GloVer-containing protein [Verrucomicrobiae bacterium]|jgi:uncharacterized repeat protein (TIGR03803 family)|nr:choice-of-anchor tandem repeat GloVer-containing protein [Verrucomicrobiae bacterium]
MAARLSAGNLAILHNFGTPLGNIGVDPSSSLVAGPDGTLYGTVSRGGLHDAGVVYSLQTNGESFPIWNFTGNADGTYPASELVLCRNTLYGTSEGYDAGTNFGTVFKVNTEATAMGLCFPSKPMG